MDKRLTGYRVAIVLTSIVAVLASIVSFGLYTFIAMSEDKISIRNELASYIDSSIEKVDAEGVSIQLTSNLVGDKVNTIECTDKDSCNMYNVSGGSESLQVPLGIALLEPLLRATPLELLLFSMSYEEADGKIRIIENITGEYTATYIVVDGLITEASVVSAINGEASYTYDYGVELISEK